MSRTDHHMPRRFRGTDDDPRTGVPGLGVSRDGLAEYCTDLERRARAELRGYAVLIMQIHRAEPDLESALKSGRESALEPDARTRHRAHHDFW